jgi:hypothetical protein
MLVEAVAEVMTCGWLQTITFINCKLKREKQSGSSNRSPVSISSITLWTRRGLEQLNFLRLAK